MFPISHIMLPYLPVLLRFLLKKLQVLVHQDFVLPAQVSRLRKDQPSFGLFDISPVLSGPVSVNVFSRMAPLQMAGQRLLGVPCLGFKMWNLFHPLNFPVPVGNMANVVAVAPAEAVLGRPSVELSYEFVTLGLCSCQALLPSASVTGKIKIRTCKGKYENEHGLI